MPKLGLWIDDELNGEIEQLHELMLSKPMFRDLKLTKTDVLKMLIRRSVPSVFIEHGALPKGADPDEWLEAMDEAHKDERAALLRIRDKF